MWILTARMSDMLGNQGNTRILEASQRHTIIQERRRVSSQQLQADLPPRCEIQNARGYDPPEAYRRRL